MRSHPGIFTSQTKQWDPEELFGLINPDRSRVTCSAVAVTRGRRCLRYQCAMDTAARQLEDMATMDPLSAAKSDRLYSIACQSVCWQHGGQANDVYCKWKSALQALGTSRKVQPSPRSPPVHVKTESDAEDEDVKWPTPRTTQRGYTQADINSMVEEMRRMQEELDNMKREAAERRRKQDEEEQLKRDREEKARREREEEEERKRKEQERKERERKERENKEREERLRERARKRAQEREEAARKEWTDAWEEYLDGWEMLKGKKCREAAPIMIPWPVKSGEWRDVTIDNVRAFFQKAPPMSANAKEERFRLMSQENKKWHTDKIVSLFGSEITSGKYGAALSLIAKLLIQLRQEAQEARKARKD